MILHKKKSDRGKGAKKPAAQGAPVEEGGVNPEPAKEEVGQTAVVRQKPAPTGGKVAGIPLDDILNLKRLVGRLGPDQLHTLIDAFAR
jgi:hypothetical protein